MNTGIQDGYNLAWKLAMVLRGDADGKILDSYNEERLENAENLLQTTDRFFNLVASPEPILSYLRMHVFPYVAGMAFSIDAVKKFIFPRVSQIGIHYRHSSLSNHEGDLDVKAGDRMPYFEVDGASVYDMLREPKFHWIHFSAGEARSVSELNGEYGEFVDQHEVTISPQVADIFGSETSFSLLLRPDNYIATISPDASLAPIESYLERCL
jgi:hypothetical protein